MRPLHTLLAFIAAFLFGCAARPVTPATNGGTAVPAADSAKVCPLHHLRLVHVDGFCFASAGCMLPSQDYLRFLTIAENKYPFPKTEFFSTHKTELYTAPTTISFCPECDRQKREAFDAFQKLSERKKESLYVHALNAAVARDKRQRELRRP